MNFYSFRLPSPVVQVYWVLKHGTYLARRWESQGGVNLYHGPTDRPASAEAAGANEAASEGG